LCNIWSNISTGWWSWLHLEKIYIYQKKEIHVDFLSEIG
jgi:hypothetical protein